MNANELKVILDNHQLWLTSYYVKGAKANLSGADLSGVNFFNANLFNANLSGANLFNANFFNANLSGANLSGANLSGANLSDANLSDANLSDADLSDANFFNANLSGANLSGAKNISVSAAAVLMTAPESGAYQAYKKLADGYIAKLQIPAMSKRSSATSRKCRAEYVKVLKIWNPATQVILKECKGMYTTKHAVSLYKVGEITSCDKWEEDRWIECAGGIHHFLTLQEAIDYQ